MRPSKKIKKELAIYKYNDKLKECFKKQEAKETKEKVSQAIKNILDERKIPKIENLRRELDFERSKNREAILCINQLRQEIARLKMVINALNY